MRALLLAALLAAPANAEVLKAPVDAYQKTIPWVVTPASTTVVEFLSTQPVIVTNIPSVVVASSVNVSGSSITAFQGGLWSVGASQQGPWIVAVASGTIQSSQSGPYVVTVGSGNVASSQAGPWVSSITSGTVTANIGSTAGLALDTTVAAGFRAGQLIGNTTFSVYVLNPTTATVAAYQQGPWVVTVDSGNISVGLAITSIAVYNVPGSTLTIQGAVSASQSGPITVSVSSGFVTVAGGSVTAFQGGLWNVGASQNGPYNVTVASGNIGVSQQGPFAVTVTSGNITTDVRSIGQLGLTTFTVTFVSTQPVVIANTQDFFQNGTFNVTVTSGTVFAIVPGTMTVYQGSSPWVVTGGTFSVVNTTIPVTQSGQWSVGASQQGPFSVSVTSGVVQAFQGGPLVVSIASGNLNVGVAFTSMAVYNVSGTSLSITGPVLASQSGPWHASIDSGSMNVGVAFTSVAVYSVVGTSLSITGTVLAFQGGPRVVSVASGNINVGLAITSIAVYNVPGTTLAIAGAVGASQQGPWVTSVSSGFITVAGGSVTVFQGDGWNVGATQSGPWNLSIASGNMNVGVAFTSVAVYNVPGTSLTVAAIQVGTWTVNSNTRDGDGNQIGGTPLRDGSGEEALNVFSISGSSAVAIPIQRKQVEKGSYFSVTSDFVTFANTAETPLFLFVNPSTGTRAAFLDNHRLSFAASNTGNGVAIFRIYRPVVVASSGTALSILPGDASSAAVSQMQAFVSPISTSFGTLAYTASSAGGVAYVPINQSRIFRPGTKFLVTVQNPSNNFKDSYDVEWSEEQ